MIVSSLMNRFDNCTFDDYIVTSEDQETALNLCKNLKHNAIMIGKLGTGKTMLAHCISRKFEEPIITTLAKISRLFRDTINKKGDEIGLINELTSTSLLVLNDIGVKKLTDFENGLLNEIIDDRSEKLLPTIITSNLNIPQLKSVVGERVISRLNQDGMVIRFEWESLYRK